MKKLRLFIQAATLFSALLLSSCSKPAGFSVLLWNDSERQIPDGTIIKVLSKSNISHVYIVQLPETKEKIEYPLWMLSEPESRSKAAKRAKKYSGYQKTYAKCIADGLPVRADKANNARQVYRLRKNEIIKPLYVGNGVAPMSGGKPLPGDWVRVLTTDGTMGWCFSYNLRLFEMNADGTYGEGAAEAEIQKTDELLEHILSSKWYPEYYQKMIKDHQIDLEFVKPEYGFDTGYTSGQITLALPEISVSCPYAEAMKTDEKTYRFDGTPFEFYARNAKTLTVTYTDERGMPKYYTFVSIPEIQSIDSVISKEQDRRLSAYKSVSSSGPDFKSGNYGTLTFGDDGKFTWTGFSKLVPSVLPKGTKGSGSVEVKYFIGKDLKANWDGVLTFTFSNNGKEASFLYKKEVNGLRLSYANVNKQFDSATGRSTSQVTLNSNSIVLFFTKGSN